MNQITDPKLDISPEALAHLGDGRIAYVKTVRSEDVRALFPQAEMPQIAPGQILFALHAADGTPMPGARSWKPSACTDQESVVSNQ
jgi:hypothetical protein